MCRYVFIIFSHGTARSAKVVWVNVNAYAFLARHTACICTLLWSLQSQLTRDIHLFSTYCKGVNDLSS